jgi:CheY-like chemotaxis protein
MLIGTDSSRRAVEAADNIVHAYELNMQIPDTPMEDGDSPAGFFSSAAILENRPHIMIQGSNIALNPRKRQKKSPVSWSFGSTTKRREVRHSPQRDVSPRSRRFNSSSPVPVNIQHPQTRTAKFASSPELSRAASVAHRSSALDSVDSDPSAIPSIRQSRIRELIPIVIYEALRIGGRPDSSIGQPTLLGEKIEVRKRSSSGDASYQIIEWSVQADVPEVLPIDERDISKLISCVFLNAVKFTENGKISVVVSLLPRSLRSVRVNIVDTGSGIPKDFVPQLFKPFSREDDSLTRTKEGLGLGLLVAKGLARKLGGDLNLVRTETSGQRRGSEFEINVPIGGIDSASKPGTPFNRTPTPSISSPHLPRSNGSIAITSNPQPSLATPLHPTSQPQDNDQRHTVPNPSDSPSTCLRRMSSTSSKVPNPDRSAFDRCLAKKHPLTFLVAEDNKINRKLLVSMLSKLGYEDVYEAFDGREAVRLMKEKAASKADMDYHEQNLTTPQSPKPIDVILMDLWMPEMDGYEATEKIFDLLKAQAAFGGRSMRIALPTVLAVSADVTEKAISRATAVGMEGFMTKPYKLVDLQRLIEEVCKRKKAREASS